MSRHLNIEYWPIDSVIPYARNARTHSDHQIDQIGTSMLVVGFTMPVLVDKDRVLIAGHGRVLAAERIGLKLIPVIQLDDLTPEQVKAYRLADNKIAANAGWDENLLRVELESLMTADIDFSVDLTGFSTPEIDLLLHTDPLPEADEVPIPAPGPAHAVSRPGDLWIMRKHRVLNSDSRVAENIDILMSGDLADMALTDAPYNVPIDGHARGLGKLHHPDFAMAAGEMSSAEYTGFLTDAFIQSARVSEDGSLLYAFMDWRHTSEAIWQ